MQTGISRNMPHNVPEKRIRNSGGFTLIELMVAIFVMSLLAMLSWRSLDGMAKVQRQTQIKTDGVLALQAGLAQWQTDLDAMIQLPQINGFNVDAWDYDGQVFRLTRRYAEQEVATMPANASISGMNSSKGSASSGSDNESIRVVAWSQRNVDGVSQWLRWQSSPLYTRAQLLAAWLQAAQWAKNPGDADKKNEVAVAAIDQWQIIPTIDRTKSNAQSSAGQTAGTGQKVPPDAVSLVLTLSAGQALIGTINRDWINPALK